ncbi:YrhC family protein [Alkalicoccobacillus murimartini]|uniref:Membrane protein YhhN n=1 Tax=Alkalicoccobacillus murimartini TaxID=171685 RepID=A0ABT9YD47_9BACI|nr:YrhC family protein [Alkalicoccobacillus murimartini]MDQ0205456.1 putative membrane protein YhhN [Alkalicoccobacillus murimartini]
MENNREKILLGKQEDYHRFGFILWSLAAFLYVGLIIPQDWAATTRPPELMIPAICVALGCALICNRLSIRARKQLDED